MVGKSNEEQQAGNELAQAEAKAESGSDKPPIDVDPAELSPKDLVRQLLRRGYRSETYSFFAGPLPPPKILAAYREAFPDCPERIVAMAEQEQDHRQAAENRVLEEEARLKRVGQLLAFLLSLSTIAGGIYLLGTGQDITGLVTLLTPLAILTGLFLYTNRAQRREAEKGKRELRELLRNLPDSQDQDDSSAKMSTE